MKICFSDAYDCNVLEPNIIENMKQNPTILCSAIESKDCRNFFMILVKNCNWERFDFRYNLRYLKGFDMRLWKYRYDFIQELIDMGYGRYYEVVEKRTRFHPHIPKKYQDPEVRYDVWEFNPLIHESIMRLKGAAKKRAKRLEFQCDPNSSQDYPDTKSDQDS